MVKEILNFPDHWGQRAEVIGAVFFKDTPSMGSSKGVSHHNAFSHLELDFIGIHADEVLIPHIGSRADPHHSHCELKNFQRRSMENKNHKTANTVMTAKQILLLANCEQCYQCQQKIIQLDPETCHKLLRYFWVVKTDFCHGKSWENYEWKTSEEHLVSQLHKKRRSYTGSAATSATFYPKNSQTPKDCYFVTVNFLQC